MIVAVTRKGAKGQPGSWHHRCDVCDKTSPPNLRHDVPADVETLKRFIAAHEGCGAAATTKETNQHDPR